MRDGLVVAETDKVNFTGDFDSNSRTIVDLPLPLGPDRTTICTAWFPSVGLSKTEFATNCSLALAVTSCAPEELCFVVIVLMNRIFDVDLFYPSIAIAIDRAPPYFRLLPFHLAIEDVSDRCRSAFRIRRSVSRSIRFANQ